MRSRTGIFGDLFPMHPQPLPDELLTSWLMRTAHANGMKLQRFLDVLVGRETPTLNRDYDRSVPYEHLIAYSEATGVTIERLYQCTLRHFNGTFITEVITKSNSPWILAAGIHHRKRFLHGLQYCQACLASDKVPYFRLRWRLAFYVECHIHHIQMKDACWSCDAPVIPYRIELGRRRSTLAINGRSCQNCGIDLAQGSQCSIPDVDYEVRCALRILVTCFNSQRAVLRRQIEEPTVEIFTDIHNLSHIVNSRRRLQKNLGHEVRRLMNFWFRPMGEYSKFSLDRARINERIEAMSLALWLVTRWPSRLQQALKCANLTPLCLRNTYRNWSREMQNAL